MKRRTGSCWMGWDGGMNTADEGNMEAIGDLLYLLCLSLTSISTE